MVPSHGVPTLPGGDAPGRPDEAQALQAMAARLQASRELERHRMALELHDVLGQQLTGLKMALAGLRPAGASADG